MASDSFSFAKELYFSLLSRLTLPARMRHLERSGPVVAILNLHRISPIDNPFWAPLHPRILDGLLWFLKKNFVVTTLAEIETCRAGHRPIAILSFDDGFRDFLDYATPILRTHRVSANLNVIGECVVTGIPTWNVRLYDFLSNAPPTLLRELNVPGFGVVPRFFSRQAKVRYGLAVSRYLRSMSLTRRAEVWSEMEAVIIKLSPSPTCATMLRPNEIREIASDHEIGAHSYSHESMGLVNDSYFASDLVRCQKLFSVVLNLPMKTYAFPNGSYRPGHIRALQRAGVERILLTGERFADPTDHVLHRINMHAQSRHEAYLRAVGYGVGAVCHVD